MSKKTKASKKRLNNLLIILLLTAVLLVMSTYAWFTSNRTVHINDITVKVETSAGLQISANGTDWKTVISEDDLLSAMSNPYNVQNQLPGSMAPCSSIGDVTNGKLDIFYGSTKTDLEDPSRATYGQYLLSAAKLTDIVATPTESNNAHYIAYDIWLRDDVDALAPKDGLYMSGSVTEFVEEGATATNKQLENAARVAVVRGNHCADAEDSETVLALTTNTGSGQKAYIWEPNCDTHTTKAKKNAKDVYGEEVDVGSGNAALDYDGVKAAFTSAAATDPIYVTLGGANQTNFPDYFGTPNIINDNWKTTKTATPNLAFPKIDTAENTAGETVDRFLEAGATKFRIYMWVEGQDVDCENSASGTQIEFNVKFSLDPFATT